MCKVCQFTTRTSASTFPLHEIIPCCCEPQGGMSLCAIDAGNKKIKNPGWRIQITTICGQVDDFIVCLRNESGKWVTDRIRFWWFRSCNRSFVLNSYIIKYKLSKSTQRAQISLIKTSHFPQIAQLVHSTVQHSDPDYPINFNQLFLVSL